MQNFINFHAIIWKKISTCYFKYQDTSAITERTGGPI